MKITKRELKKLIKEEVSDMSAIEDLLKDLLSQLEKLDLSIDYLASSLTGQDPLAIGVAQKSMGRLAEPPSRSRRRDIGENNKITKKNLKDLVKQIVSEDLKQTIDLGALEDELEGRTDKEMEEDMVELAKRLIALEKKIKEMSDQYQAGIDSMKQITGRMPQNQPQEQ
jgi:hypothetical protein